MSREEELIRSTTQAIASTVREVPPLRLEPAADELRSPARAPRRAGGGRPRGWLSWGVPLTAAAVVVALAIALVVIKDLPDGSPVSASPAPSPASPAASPAGSDGAPRYLVALKQVPAGTPTVTGTEPYPDRDEIVVGDSLTGKTLATILPAADQTFQSVTADTDGLTFVVFGVSSANGSFLSVKGSTLTGRWYELRLYPGTARPARLTPLPIEPSSWTGSSSGAPAPGQVYAMALSGSGRELAVAETPPAPGGMAVKVFSLATGGLLHDWTTNDPSSSAPGASIQGAVYPSALTWIDGDQALALTTSGKGTSSGPAPETVRWLNVTGPPTGDLLADSKVIWTTPAVPSGSTDGDTGVIACGVLRFDRVPPVISTDGKTATCASLSQSSRSTVGTTVTFSTYQLAAGTAAVHQGTVAYQVTQQEPASSGSSGGGSVQWVSPSGSTLIGEWSLGAANSSPPLHVGVISHGTFTPLRLPAGFTQANVSSITW
jgi:hypothetical protein